MACFQMKRKILSQNQKTYDKILRKLNFEKNHQKKLKLYMLTFGHYKLYNILYHTIL